MQNKLADLNNYLFAQMERLDDEELIGEELRNEIERARAIAGVGTLIISNASLVLNVIKTRDEVLGMGTKLPPMLLGE